jgi:hypothetical protein
VGRIRLEPLLASGGARTLSCVCYTSAAVSFAPPMLIFVLSKNCVHTLLLVLDLYVRKVDASHSKYECVSKSFRTESITK